MQVEIQHHEFNKNLFFYDLVSSFSISLCGCPVIFEEEIEVYKMANQILSFPGAYSQTKHLSPFQLRKQALRGDIDKSKHITSCCMMLANTAYESVKEYNDGSEIFEFFRHIRNASSHLNVFQFNHKEPAHPAQWRGAIIEHQQKGDKNALFAKPCFGHFIGVADLLDLLMDIEHKIIKKNIK
jgi:hypothetical protein